MAKRKSTMAVPVKWGQQERLFGETVKEGLDVLLGHRGSPFQRAVTFQDLLDTNVLRLASNVGLSTVTGNSSDFEVPTENANIQIPPAPTGLSASGAFQNIILTWDLKTYVGHAFVEIHRHTSDSISDATLLARVSGFTGIYSDAVGTNASYYYWVRAVNVNDDIGPFNSSIGVNGTTQPDVSVILDLLEEQITTSELATSLATQISDIDSLSSGLETFTGYTSGYIGNSLISRLEGTEGTASSANTLAGNLETFTGYLSSYTGDSLATRLTANESLASSASTTASSANSTATTANNLANNLETFTGYTADYTGSALVSRVSTAEGAIDDVEDDIGSINTSITNINSSISTINTAIGNLDDALADVTAGTSSVFVQTTAPVDSTTDPIPAFSRWYDSDDNNKAYVWMDDDGDGTNTWVSIADTRVADNASSITDLNAQVFDENDNLRLATASALDSLDSTVTSQGDTISSHTSSITALDSAVFNSENQLKLVETSAFTALQDDVVAIYDPDDETAITIISAIQSNVTSLQGAVFDANSEVKLAETSVVEDLENDVLAIYDPEDATSLVRVNQSAINSLNAAVFDENNGVKLAETSVTAGLRNDIDAIYDADDATSLLRVAQSDISDLNAEVFTNGESRLAELSAFQGLEQAVTTIYDADDETSLVQVLQSNVSSLQTAVFADGEVQLATVESLEGLTNSVEAIYDENNANSLVRLLQADVTSLKADVYTGGDPDAALLLATQETVGGLASDLTAIYEEGSSTAVVNVLQSDVSSLNAAVFTDGEVALATTAVTTGIQNQLDAIYDPNDADAETQVSIIQSDISDLNAEVFLNGGSRLATAEALSGLTNKVTAIYNPDDPDAETQISLVQGDISTLEGAVFDSDNNLKLAETSVTDGLQNNIDAIYDPDDPDATTQVSLLQARATSLEGAVFDSNNDVKLASGSALQELTNDVLAIYNADDADADTVIGSIQTDVTALEGIIYDENSDVAVASATAVSLLNTEVWGDGVDPSSATSSRIDSLIAVIDDDENGLSAVSEALSTVTSEVYPQGVGKTSAIGTLRTAVFDSDNNLLLAEATAVNALETEVFGTGGASASRIDGLYSAIYDEDDNTLFASASAFTDLQTTVSGEGGLASKVDNIATAMFVEGDTSGDLNLATAEDLSTVTAKVFPDGTTETSRIEQLSSAVWSGGNPDNDLVLASADIVSDLEAVVFPEGGALASSIETLQVQVQGEDGNGGAIGSIQTLQEVVGDENGGLSSQYSVKLDNHGHVSGFGLSNTTNNGTPTSAFIIRADKFALVNPDAENTQSNDPANSTDVIVPFTVQANAILDEDGATIVPAGVYMDTAFIRKGSITNAFIEDATIDYAKIASVDAETITTGTLNTSRLNLDDSTLTSVNGVLQVGDLNASKITSGTISADVMEGTTVYANKLTGDVSVMTNFRDTTTQNFRGGAYNGDYGGTLKFLEETLPASSHETVGHIPYAQASGWFSSTSSKTYSIKMYMKTASSGGSSTTVGTATTASSFTSGGTTYYYVQISGNKTSLVGTGSTITSGNKSHTVTSATYFASSGLTIIYYTLVTGSAFSTGNSISTTGSTGGNWTLVGETRVKATTNLYMPFSLSGTLGNRTTEAADMKLEMTRYGSSGVTDADTGNALDNIGEVTGMIIGMR